MMVFMALALVLIGQFCPNVTSNKYSDKWAISSPDSITFLLISKSQKNHIDLYREIQNIGNPLDSFIETPKLLSQ